MGAWYVPAVDSTALSLVGSQLPSAESSDESNCEDCGNGGGGDGGRPTTSTRFEERRSCRKSDVSIAAWVAWSGSIPALRSVSLSCLAVMDCTSDQCSGMGGGLGHTLMRSDDIKCRTQSDLSRHPGGDGPSSRSCGTARWHNSWGQNCGRRSRMVLIRMTSYDGSSVGSKYRHTGHAQLECSSHGMMQSRWNKCAHGNRMAICPDWCSSQHTLQCLRPS